MNQQKLSEEFWHMSNIIAGFALVQVIGLGFAALDGRVKFERVASPWVMLALVIVGYLGYAGATWWCGKASADLAARQPEHDAQAVLAMRRINLGRVALVVFSAVVALLVIALRAAWL
jgi:hypothetical protein